MKTETAQKILEKTKRDYEQLAEEFSNTRANLWFELQELAKYVKGGDKILDLGCGNGRLYELFSGRFDSRRTRRGSLSDRQAGAFDGNQTA